MKRHLVCAVWMICLLFLLLPADVQASSLTEKLEALRLQIEADQKPVRHNFWFWLNEKEDGYAQWERVSGGVNFSIKVKNNFSYDKVDAYTFEISAKNVYEEPIMLKASDGTYSETLHYTGEKTFSPGKSGYTEYFRLRSSEKIRYVYVKLIKYHTDEGTVYVDESHQTEHYWKID